MAKPSKTNNRKQATGTRIMHAPVGEQIYDQANMARVGARMSWREVLELALAEFTAKRAVGGR